MQDIDKCSMICGMFMPSTLEASVFMGKNYSDNLHSIRNRGEYLNLKQMFDISEKLILEQSDEIFSVLNNCNVVAQLVTSQPDAVDTTMTFT